MQPLIVDDQIWELFPEAQFQVLVAHGIDNHLAAMQTEHYQAMLDNAVKEAQKFITDDVFRNNPVISEWRDAFTKFKKKKAPVRQLKRCSNEFPKENRLVQLTR